MAPAAPESYFRLAAVAAESGASTRAEGDSRGAVLYVAQSRSYDVRGQPPPDCCLQLLTCRACDRGGCCRQSPAQVVVSQDGVVQRINLLLRVQGCCSNEDTGVADTIPPELAYVLSQADLQPWLDELRGIGQLRTSCCRGLCYCLACMWVPCIWPWACRQYAHEILTWNEALADWQRRFNTQLLYPRGMAVKTQSHCDVTYDKDGKHRHIERWVAFAMNPTEAQRLMYEPHLTGDVERGSCGGIDEAGLVLHP